MKQKFLLMLTPVFVLLFSTHRVFSQENPCESGYMPFKQDLSFELTSYDKKGKVSSVPKQMITALDEMDGGFEARVEMEIADEKGENVTTGKYDMQCKDGVIYVDVSSMLDPRTMETVSSMEMEMSGDALQFPNQLEPGQTLPDGTLVMKAKTNGMTLMTISMDITNRRVGELETVTTPAGTFECVKISQDSQMKMLVKKTFRSTSWYAKGVGMVKTENYDKKGNLESSTVLTKLEH